MNKVIPIVVILILIAGIGVFLSSQTKKEETTMKPDSTEKITTNQNNTTRYIEYSKTAFDEAQDKRRVLYFYASWCPICRPADQSFQEFEEKIPEDVVLLRVNYADPETDQEEKDLAKKYGITYQHTFVQIDSQDSEVTKWNGGQIDELLKRIR